MITGEILHQLVEFDKWCPSCKDFNTPDNHRPCEKCLTVPINLYTTKPVNYEEAK